MTSKIMNESQAREIVSCWINNRQNDAQAAYELELGEKEFRVARLAAMKVLGNTTTALTPADIRQGQSSASLFDAGHGTAEGLRFWARN